MGPILCRPTNGSSSCTGEFSLVGRGKEKTMSRRSVGMSHGGSSILLPSSLQAQKTSKSSRRRKVSLSYQDRNSDFNSPYGGNRWARRGHNWASPSVTTRRVRRRESSPTESVLGQPRVQKELDMDVIERAQRWFNGEEPEKEVDDSNWFDSIVDNSKLAVDPGTPVYDLEEDSGSTIAPKERRKSFLVSSGTVHVKINFWSLKQGPLGRIVPGTAHKRGKQGAGTAKTTAREGGVGGISIRPPTTTTRFTR